MRLIDGNIQAMFITNFILERKEKIIDILQKSDNDYLFALMMNYFDEQPTAYSVAKVVEELESFAKLAEDRWTNGTSKHAYQEHKCWVKAIEIVKHGGVSDDVCECRLFKGHKYLHETSCGNVFDMENNFKYCPFCGKKIKVVE